MTHQFRATNSVPYKLAKGLGWFSIGLGLAELAAPGKLARTLGLRKHDAIVRGFGLREMGTGVAILTQKDPTPWIWARVAGDVLDLASVLPAVTSRHRRRGTAIAAALNVAGIMALDYFCARELQATKARSRPVRDYSDRVGLSRSPDEMRGIAARGMRPRAGEERAAVAGAR